MKKRTYISIDGGYLTYLMRDTGYFVSADNIERAALACIGEDEELWRILFYHCREFEGKTPLPVSGDLVEWQPKSHSVVDDLARKNFFAVRLGMLSFRGWRKKSGVRRDALSDEDFSPVFEQKGVDMRIGLDMAMIAEKTDGRPSDFDFGGHRFGAGGEALPAARHSSDRHRVSRQANFAQAAGAFRFVPSGQVAGKHVAV